MPIRPIDLQTLFMQMGQVGREQAAEKEGVALQQSIQGAVEQKRADEAKEAVRRPEDPETGADPVKDRRGRSGGRGLSGGRGRPGEAEEASPEEEEEIVKDPSLGNKIDLSG
ncbi:MAG: hypothetical protein JNG85_01175 [Spirochaetaceae bacterium]|nr:hypothetical protein [Spirochaetaceae bacterium]